MKDLISRAMIEAIRGSSLSKYRISEHDIYNDFKLLTQKSSRQEIIAPDSEEDDPPLT